MLLRNAVLIHDLYLAFPVASYIWFLTITSFRDTESAPVELLRDMGPGRHTLQISVRTMRSTRWV
jgi:hypothetical protein